MSLTLSKDEIANLTGYKTGPRQLGELHRQGFYRARMGRDGVILERGHYDAVVAGKTQPEPPKKINLAHLRLA